MKVVVSGYVGKKITGIGRNLLSLLENVSEEHHYIVYINEDMRDDFNLDKPNVEFKTYKVSKNSSLGNLLWTSFVFPFKAKKENCDVALIPNFTLLLFKLCPTAVIIHDLIEFNVPDKFSKLKMFYRTKIADPLMAKRSNRIMTISQASSYDLESFLSVPSDKIDIVLCGVDKDKFVKMDPVDASAQLMRFSIEAPFILYVGTVDHPGKNSYTLIKAFEKLCEQGHEGKLVLAGMPGKGFEVIDEQIRMSVYADRIIVTGYVSDEELLALYSMCDVFCFPSLYEGFGMPILEALSCGARVVTSNTSSMPEVLGECGWAVDPVDVDALSTALQEALNSEIDEQRINEHLGAFSPVENSKQFESFLNRAAGV